MKKRSEEQRYRSFIKTFSLINICLSLIIVGIVLFSALGVRVWCCSPNYMQGDLCMSIPYPDNPPQEIPNKEACQASGEYLVQYKFNDDFFGSSLDQIGFYLMGSFILLLLFNLGCFVAFLIKRKFNLHLAIATMGIMAVYVLPLVRLNEYQGEGSIFSVGFTVFSYMLPTLLVLFFSILSLRQNKLK